MNTFVALFLNGRSASQIRQMATLLLATGKPKCSHTLLFAALFGTICLPVATGVAILLTTPTMWLEVTFQSASSGSQNTRKVAQYAAMFTLHNISICRSVVLLRRGLCHYISVYHSRALQGTASALIDAY